MAIGDAINQPIPAVGTAGTTYATQLVDFLNEVKARLIAKVPLSSLLIGTLDMANNGLQNVAYLGLYNQDDQPASPVGSLAVYQNNLWFVSTAGAFSLTNGASLNASAVKGFTGDYGSPNPAEARFTDLDKTFYFYDDYAGGAWAYTRQRYAELANAATGSVRLRLAFTGPDSYTLTFPTALPSVPGLVQMNADGTLTMATSLYHSDDFEMQVSFASDTSTGVSIGNQGITSTANPWSWESHTLPVKVGDRITRVKDFWSVKNGNTGCTLYLKYETGTGVATTVDSWLLNDTGTQVAHTRSVGTPVTVAAGQRWYLEYAGGTTTGDSITALDIQWDHPST